MLRKTALLLSILALLAAGPAASAQEVAAGAGEATPAERLSRLRGQVRESRTRDVVGVTVLVQRNGDRGRFHLTSSGAGGEFFVDGLPDGEYTVRLNREGYASEVKRGIRLKYPFRAVVEVRMEPGQVDLGAVGDGREAGPAEIGLRGGVRDGRGHGLGEVWVRVVRPDGSVDPIVDRTALDGTFAFEALPAGEWRLEIVGIGYLPLRQNFLLRDDAEIDAHLVAQPPGYVPAPLDLMPPEVPVVPDGFR